jgi:chromosome partitioning protein
MAVRKLLVASQKSGVGKTTSSINLAAAAAAAGARVLLLDADPLSGVSMTLNLTDHPRRRLLRADGIDLPGVLCSDVIPGLDVLSPYGDGACSDEEFDELLRLVASPVPGRGYSCLVVDSPPFMGANPGQLLGSCDDLVLVMRAEPMAYRTLPAFLELVQRSRKNGRGVQMRGILLTLPDGELPGGRWERELRGRFGARILPHVIPFDEEVARALEAGQILSHAQPESAAAAQYHALAGTLALAPQEAVVSNGAGSPLLSAAAALDAAGVPVGRSSASLIVAPPPARPAPPVAPPAEDAEDAEEVEEVEVEEVADSGDAEAEIVLPEPEPEPEDTVAGATEAVTDTVPAPPTAPPGRRRLPRPTPARPLPRYRSASPPSDADIPDLDELLARQTPPPGARPAPPARPSGLKPAAARAAAAPPKSSPAVPSSSTPAVPMTSKQPWMIWVGLATVIGIGLRFVQVPDFMLPVAVGIAVAAAVVLVLKLVAPAPQPPPPPAPFLPPPLPPASRPVAKAPPPSSKRLPRPDLKKDANARPGALARRPGANPVPKQRPRG